jgi:membrane protease subunit HflK
MRYVYYVLLVAFLLSLLTGVRTIEPGEKAVVLRFGRILPDRPGPGLYVGLPWGIDQVYRVQVQRVRSVQIGYAPEQDDETGTAVLSGQLVTGDHNMVNIQAVIYYVVRDDDNEIARFVFQQQRVEELLARTAETVLSQWVATHGVDTVILTGKAAKLGDGQTSLHDVLVDGTQQRLEKYELGIDIKDARINILSPPAAVKPAFDKVYQAETQIKTLKFQAEEEARAKKSAAKARAHDIEQSANAYYYKKKAMAEAQAKSFERWVELAKKMKAQDPYYLNSVWWDQVTELYTILKANGQIDLLDHRLGPGGLDFTVVPSMGPKK